MHAGHPSRLLVLCRVFATSHADRDIPAADQNEIGMHDIEGLAGTTDDTHRDERALAQSPLDIIGTKHIFPPHKDQLYLPLYAKQ